MLKRYKCLERKCYGILGSDLITLQFKPLYITFDIWKYIFCFLMFFRNKFEKKLKIDLQTLINTGIINVGAKSERILIN